MESLEYIIDKHIEVESYMATPGDPGQGGSNDPLRTVIVQGNDPALNTPGSGLPPPMGTVERRDAGNPQRESGQEEHPEHPDPDPTHNTDIPMDPIWEGAADGRENVARRTPIMATPQVAQYSTREADPNREANWQHRGLQPLEFTSQQLARMRQLRTCTMEFVAISGNKYIPTGYGMDDLLRLYTADSPPILSENDLVVRSIAAEILQLKSELRVKDQTLVGIFSRLDRMEDTLQEHQDALKNWETEEGLDDGIPEPGEVVPPTVPIPPPVSQGQTGWPQWPAVTAPQAVAVPEAPAVLPVPPVQPGTEQTQLGQLQYMKKQAPWCGVSDKRSSAFRLSTSAIFLCPDI